jgi:hypothetical protein
MKIGLIPIKVKTVTSLTFSNIKVNEKAILCGADLSRSRQPFLETQWAFSFRLYLEDGAQIGRVGGADLCRLSVCLAD